MTGSIHTLKDYFDFLWKQKQIIYNQSYNFHKKLLPPQLIKDRVPWEGEEPIQLPRQTFEEIVNSAVPGLICEFGVFTGKTLEQICSATPGIVYGFDSFKGITEPWSIFCQGYWALPNYEEIKWPDNAEIIVGSFADTLPGFLAGHSGPLAYAHINSGVYSAARDVLANIADRIIVGTILHFGEIKMYPGADHEVRAFNEYLARYGGEWELYSETSDFDAVFRKVA